MWDLLRDVLPACCAPDPNAEEIKMPNVTDEAFQSAAPGTEQRATENGYQRYGANCCAQVADGPEVVVVQQVPSVQQDRSAPFMPQSPDPSTNQESPSAPVPQIVGLSSLSKVAVIEERPKGNMEVDLVREGAQWSNLGMIVSPNASNPDNLNIDEVDEQSLLGEWNLKRALALQVWPGDVIVAVNGRSGQDLIREIQQLSAEGSHIKFLLVRGTGVSA